MSLRESLPRPVESTFSLKLCPRCEEGVLLATAVPYEIDIGGTPVQLERVQAEECKRCGYRALSGRETKLFEVLFEPRFASLRELIDALRAAGFRGLFLRRSERESRLALGSSDYVAGLPEGLRDIYLDNESGHVLSGLDGSPDRVSVELGGKSYTVRLPKVGEGENGVVFDYDEGPGNVLKLAKPRAYSREHVRQECELTDFYAGHGVPVPAIVEAHPYGSFCVKERLRGRSLAVLYPELGPPASERHRTVRQAVECFARQLLDLFVRHPEAKTSISPNNIFVEEVGDICRCLLVDTGPAPLHDYSAFDFAAYWSVTVPEKIARYRSVGFI